MKNYGIIESEFLNAGYFDWYFFWTLTGEGEYCKLRVPNSEEAVCGLVPINIESYIEFAKYLINEVKKREDIK